MREYKFRAWDKKKRKMIYLSPNDTILFQNGKCTVWKENQYDETEECFCCETFSNVIPMLYSGRKDKNGEEIYEGDLVMVADYASWEGLYKVIWDEENLMYMIEDAYGDREKLCEFEEYLKKGNIYENLELLERCI